jgi:predicted 2-oxoglutarate/Fe(II)-dependent dioxygenase YbiX
MEHAFPTTNRIYQFSEFDWLANPPRPWINYLIEFNSSLIVGTVDTAHIIPLSLPLARNIKRNNSPGLAHPISGNTPRLGEVISSNERLPQLIPPIEESLADEENLSMDSTVLPATIPINQLYIEDLFRAAGRSQVGHGRETIYNENVRASSEILAEHITIYPQFMDNIKVAVSQMAIQLGQPTEVEPHLYKLVIYKEGDHFDDHIDNEHGENMVMTLSVEFPFSDNTAEERYLAGIVNFQRLIGVSTSSTAVDFTNKGGDLIINNENVPHPTINQLGLTLFYHDTHHHITQVKRGYRMSLIFDVMQKPNKLIPQVIQQYLPSFTQGIQKLRAQGVRRIGTPTNHIYILAENSTIGNISSEKLKGMDRTFMELVRNVSHDIYLEGIALDDTNNFYFDAIIAVIKLQGGFNTVYSYREEEEEREEAGSTMSQPVAFTNYTDIQQIMDANNVYRAVNPKYKMGDIILLKSKGNLRHTYKGDEEIYTGNEGFYGEIYTNLGIFAEI